MGATRNHTTAGVILTAGLLVAALTGCGHTAGPADRTGGWVAYVANSLRPLFARQMAEGYQHGAGQIPGVTAKVAAPETLSSAEEARFLRRMIGDGARALCLSGLITDQTFDAPLAQAVEKGVQLMAMDNPPQPGQGIEFYVGNDNRRIGRILADLVATELPAGASGQVILGTPRIGSENLDARVLGFIQQMGERLPRVRVVGPLDTAERPNATENAWTGLARTNPHALAFVSVGADGSLLDKVKTAQHARWVAAATDIDPASLQAVKRGELLLVSPEHFLKGAVGGRIQAAYARSGERLPTGWLEIPVVAVSQRNVDEIIEREVSPAARQAYYAAQIDALTSQVRAGLRPLSEIQ